MLQRAVTPIRQRSWNLRYTDPRELSWMHSGQGMRDTRNASNTEERQCEECRQMAETPKRLRTQWAQKILQPQCITNGPHTNVVANFRNKSCGSFDQVAVSSTRSRSLPLVKRHVKTTARTSASSTLQWASRRGNVRTAPTSARTCFPHSSGWYTCVQSLQKKKINCSAPSARTLQDILPKRHDIPVKNDNADKMNKLCPPKSSASTASNKIPSFRKMITGEIRK